MSRQKRKRKRINGQDVIIKRPDAAHNALPKRQLVTRTSMRKVLKSSIDRRTCFGRAYVSRYDEMVDHLSVIPTPPQRQLIDQCVRLSLMSDMAWGEYLRCSGYVDKTDAVGWFDLFTKASREHRSVLQLLGIERKVKDLPDLSKYVETTYGHDN